MLGDFVGTFQRYLGDVAPVFFVICLAWALAKRGTLTQDHIAALAKATVRVFLPFMIFSRIVKDFHPEEMEHWWLSPLGAAAMVLGGLGIASLAFFWEISEKRNLLPAASMQNAGYFVLPLGPLLFAGADADLFELYCFLYIVPISIIMWSLGKVLTTGSTAGGWISLITPPFLANIFGLLLVFTGLRTLIPSWLVEGMELIGRPTPSVALVVLGGVLSTAILDGWRYWFDAVRVIGVKLFAIPALTIPAVFLLDLHHENPVLATLLVVQSSSAPATAHLLQLRTYGGDEKKIGSIMLFSYLLSIVTLPLWLSVWQAIAG